MAVDISTYSDEDFVRRFLYRTTDDPPVAIDLTGSALVMKVRRAADDEEAVLELTTADGALPIEAGTGGGFSLFITRARLLRLPPGSYVHSLIRIAPSGLHLPIWRGKLVHAAGVSR